MILLKTVVLFVMANPAEFYPLSPEEEAKPCGKCSIYIEYGAFKVPEYPNYFKLKGEPLKACLNKNNDEYACGQSNPNGLTIPRGLPVMKNDNTTETKNTKIVGGSETKRNQFPWQVGVADGLGISISCGGSIISSKEILTAAHCVFIDSKRPQLGLKKCLYVVVGNHDISKRSDEQWNRICNVQPHPHYASNQELTLVNDFAVLTMCRELLFQPNVSPVCLPPLQGLNTDGTQDVEATGWGDTSFGGTMSNKLKIVEMKTMPNEECFAIPMLYAATAKHDSKICAYDGEGKGTCHGDSGGPLVMKKQIQDKFYHYLIGVTSYARECAKVWYPTVFGRVTEAMKWIRQDDLIKGNVGNQPVFLVPRPPPGPGPGSFLPPICRKDSKLMELRKNTKNSRSSKNTEGVTYYRFEKDKKLSRKKAQETCISKYGGQLTSINTQDEYDWIKEQVIDLKMFGQIAIGGQWKDKSSRKFEWTDKSEMDMSVLNANWFRTRNYRFPSYKNKKRINLELWYSRRAMGFANTFHKAPTMYICKVAESCTSCSSCSA